MRTGGVCLIDVRIGKILLDNECTFSSCVDCVVFAMNGCWKVNTGGDSNPSDTADNRTLSTFTANTENLVFAIFFTSPYFVCNC